MRERLSGTLLSCDTEDFRFFYNFNCRKNLDCLQDLLTEFLFCGRPPFNFCITPDFGKVALLTDPPQKLSTNCSTAQSTHLSDSNCGTGWGRRPGRAQRVGQFSGRPDSSICHDVVLLEQVGLYRSSVLARYQPVPTALASWMRSWPRFIVQRQRSTSGRILSFRSCWSLSGPGSVPENPSTSPAPTSAPAIPPLTSIPLIAFRSPPSLGSSLAGHHWGRVAQALVLAHLLIFSLSLFFNSISR